MTSAAPAVAAGRWRARHRHDLRRITSAVARGLLDDALADCQALLAADADHPAALYGLGAVAVVNGEDATALKAFTLAHERDPEEPVFSEALAILHARAGDVATAVYYAKISAALGLDRDALDLLPAALPSFAAALQSITEAPYRTSAERLVALGDDGLAIVAYEQHLAFFPQDIAAIRGYAEALLRRDQPVKVAAALTGLHRQGGAEAQDLSLLGEAFGRMGEAEAAQGCHRAALARAPDDPAIGCAMLRDAVYAPGQSAAALADMCRAWGASVAGAETAAAAPAPAGRALRVGFLLSAWRDPRDLEVVATIGRGGAAGKLDRYYYGRGELDHPANAVLRDGATWRTLDDLDPLTLAAMVGGDEVDILLDVGGHAAPTQLLAMAQRPAPKLVSWLGNPAVLGLPQLDFELVGDPTEMAPDAPPTGGAARWLMPHGLYAYALPERRDGRPAERRGAVVFGAEVALPQLHPDLLACWASILERTPGAVLALRDQDFVRRDLADRLAARFGAAGIADRVEVIAADAPDFWSQIDIALAPFVAINPHDAAGALAQGVPVVALAGSGRHRRQASALLHHAGLGDGVAGTVAGYRDRAVMLAGSVEARAAARNEAVQAVETSAVFDPARYAAAFHDALARMAEHP